MTGMSCSFVAVTARLPSPGSTKTASTKTEALSALTKTRPITVTTGMAPLRSACFQMMDRRGMPLARSVRM